MDSGRRPELESDEISVTTPLDVEIFGHEVDTFPRKVYTYWDFGSVAEVWGPDPIKCSIFSAVSRTKWTVTHDTHLVETKTQRI